MWKSLTTTSNGCVASSESAVEIGARRRTDGVGRLDRLGALLDLRGNAAPALHRPKAQQQRETLLGAELNRPQEGTAAHHREAARDDRDAHAREKILVLVRQANQHVEVVANLRFGDSEFLCRGFVRDRASAVAL